MKTYQKVGLILGPLVFAIMLIAGLSQEVMSSTAWRTAAIGLWMAIWWATEAVPVAVTAMMPIVSFAPLGITSIDKAVAPYSSKIIYLFLGGFLMALAVERWNLHRRIALAILNRTGTNGRRIIFGFMLVCCLLSMWMTNTSTTMMLLPIVLSVVLVIRDNVTDLTPDQHQRFEIAMLLGLAYAASIGGLATLIGTPPNGFLSDFMAREYEVEISFAHWMIIGVPVSLIMLPLAWFVLTHYLFPVNFPANDAVKQHLAELKDSLGEMTTPEKRVAILFGLVILAWMTRKPVGTLWPAYKVMTDAGIVMTAAVLLFAIPSGHKSQAKLMTWDYATRLPWGVLILFGGGLSLAAAVSSSGLALWLGETLAPLGSFGTAVLVIAAVAMVIFLTELTSNLATTATLLPVMGAIALQAGMPPLILMVPVTIAASCAFMLPVATAPNAIVFSTGKLSIPQMVRAGIMLNILGIILVSLIALFVVPEVFG